MPPQPLLRITLSIFVLAAGFLLVRFGWGPLYAWMRRQELAYDRVFRRQLLIDLAPRTALALHVGGILIAVLVGYFASGSVGVALVLGTTAFFIPHLVIRHLEIKRRQHLETQLIDGLTTLASGTRAGLNLVQAMELLAANHRGPIQQEFSQILREYGMGLDLNQAMRAASDRIGSPLYRLTFTAIEMHRLRGGDTGESMDRIAESIREIHRLEGKLDAITAQGRSQAWMMAVMPLVFLGILYAINPTGVTLLFSTNIGRIILLFVVALIVLGFLWIRKIMRVDI